MKAKYWKAHLIFLLAVNKVVSSANFQQVSLAATPGNTHPGLLRSNGGALASALRLRARGAEEPQQQPPPATTFWGQLRERFTSVDSSPASSDPSSSVVISDHTSIRRTSSMSALGDQVARALKNGLMQSGARVRSRGLLALLTVACILSVVGATASGVVSRPWGAWHRSAPNLPVVETSTEVDTANEEISTSSKSGKGRHSERRRRLLKTPRFPLAHISWWKAVQDRRKVSGTAGEDLCMYVHALFQNGAMHEHVLL